MYRLFLDDERDPDDVTWVKLPPGPWEIVRNYDEFCEIITRKGLPEFVSFDHDLSFEHYSGNDDEKTGKHCAQWMVDYCLDNNQKIPSFQVHSMNPAGAKNIKSLLDQAKKYLNSL